MKILQLIQKPQLRGAELFACQLSNRLQEAGHEVWLVSIFPGAATLPFSGKHLMLNRPLRQRLFDIQGWGRLARIIRDVSPDIVQANAGDTLKFAVFSKLVYRWKVPLTFRNANKVSDFINTAPKLLFNKFLVRNVQQVISVSEVCRMDFVNTYAYAQAKTATVPIGIDLQPVNRNLPPDLTSYFSSGKLLVHVASFVPEKNHTGLLRIVRKLIDRGEDIKIILIGDGKLKPVVELQVANLKLADRVWLAGYREDVLTIMANAHAFVLPSRTEGLPGVILEAMYCKIPVVAYDVGGIPEIVKPGETGWLVNKNNEDGFADAVQDVLTGRDAGQITENAYRLVVNEFDNRMIARRFEAIYREVLARR